jgi:hypothetical protein
MSQQLTSDGFLTPSPPPFKPSPVAHLHEYRQSKNACSDLEPLRKQVSDIIDAILAGSSPDEAELREQLRRHVARHPDRPEKALLRHLISLSGCQDEAG